MISNRYREDVICYAQEWVDVLLIFQLPTIFLIC
jgi:hypothetical protein